MRRWLYRWIKQNAHYITWKVLDFGCGEKPYQELFHCDQYIWVDFENTWHDNTNNVIDYYWNGKKLPFGDDSFDSIITTEVFEHIFNIDEVLQEIHRVLRKWWNLLITIPFVIHEHEVPYDFARYTSFWIAHLLEKHGFTIIKNEKQGSYFDVLLQLTIWFLWKITETKYKYGTLFLRMLLVAPVMIILNLLSLLSPNMQSWMYLNNIVVWEKK